MAFEHIRMLIQLLSVANTLYFKPEFTQTYFQYISASDLQVSHLVLDYTQHR
jgi:hypothetical protein